MNFRVIEDYEYDGFYEDFKKDFLNAMPIKELMEKYDIGKTKCYTMGVKVRKEEGLVTKPRKETSKNNVRFIRERGGHWQIIKTVNGKKEYFGSYDDLDTAILIRDRLIDVDWDKNLYPEIRDIVLLEINLK